jgi:hypothetical protein
MLSWFIFVGLGKLLIYLFMKFPLPKFVEKINFISKLHDCDLCSGVWIYSIIALIWKIDVTNLWFGLPYVFIVGEIVTGCLTSFLVHIFSIGFREKFLNVTVI